MTDDSSYARATIDLRQRLARAVPPETLAGLTRRQPWRHFLVLARMLALLAASSAACALADRWYLWLPCAVVSGFTLFGFTVMLHEVVHETVFPGASPANRVLGALYAFPSGVSRTQFTRWHLDHHARLGDAAGDPKRHHLSPKRNARWLKALYATPALFFIYFRAAARETATYPPGVRARVRRERWVTIVGQLAILAALIVLAGPQVALRTYVVPYVFVFPVAFALNRLGQHYDIDPADPAKWSTLMAASRWWDFVFLWSGYHLEHHYFPAVPFYRLRRLHFLLRPFYAERGIVASSYGRLVWQWLVLNRAPHTNWRAADG